MARTKRGVGDHQGRTKVDVTSPEFRPVADLEGKLVLERYRVGEILGAGAMGTVYRGQHEELRRPVAIKVLHAHLGDEPMMLARFHREAKAAGRLTHPNIASVIDVGFDHGRQIMVLELAEGPSLGDVVGVPLPAERVAHLVRELLHALDCAHAAGVVHRDLKPENIILSTAADGRDLPRIVDFGIAVLREDTMHGARLTTSGMVIGTPSYMAPEQAQAEPVDHRVDLFSLGVIAYEMLTGKIPFDGSAMEISLAYISKDPPPISERAPGVTVAPALELFVRRLMARRLADRFASAGDARAMLAMVETDPARAERELALLDAHRASDLIGLPPTPPYGRKRNG
jgi:serine/threonine-protein kinase